MPATVLSACETFMRRDYRGSEEPREYPRDDEMPLSAGGSAYSSLLLAGRLIESTKEGQQQ